MGHPVGVKEWASQVWTVRECWTGRSGSRGEGYEVSRGTKRGGGSQAFCNGTSTLSVVVSTLCARQSHVSVPLSWSASLLVAACQSPQPPACVLSPCNRPGLATCRCCTPTDCTSNGGGAAPTAPRIHLPPLPLGPAAAGLSHIGSSIFGFRRRCVQRGQGAEGRSLPFERCFSV